MNLLYLGLLLLPVAFFCGWKLGRKGGAKAAGQSPARFSSDYFQGLNYLLNEEQDKAMEVFLRLVEDDADSIETHQALGNLFRRRGEVDHAIRIHRHLVSRLEHDDEARVDALLELGEDYMRAGLLDRAEALFTDLVSLKAHEPEALERLIAIYQHERDWHEAIRNARKLESMGGDSQAHVIAQFYCELAEQARRYGAQRDAVQYLDAALANEASSIRPQLIRGHMLVAEDNDREAIAVFEQAACLDADYIPEILPELLQCYGRTGSWDRAERFLGQLMEHYKGTSLVLAIAEVRGQRQGRPAAAAFLKQCLAERPSVRGTLALMDATMDSSSGETWENFKILRTLADKLLEGQPRYRCSHCGFGAKGHHWQCPSCKQWGSIRPIHGAANE